MRCTHGFLLHVILVPQVPLSISQSTSNPVSGQPYTLTCTATVHGVVLSLVMLNWTVHRSISEYVKIPTSSRVVLSDLITSGIQIMRTVTFLPLLRSDSGEYLCNVEVHGNMDANNSRHAVISVNG